MHGFSELSRGLPIDPAAADIAMLGSVALFGVLGAAAAWFFGWFRACRRSDRAHTGQLRDAEERYRILIESATDYAIFTMDPNSLVTSWNSGAERLLGFTQEEILGRSAFVIFTPEDRAAGAARRELEKAAETGRAINERWHVRKDGSRFWGSGIVVPLRGPAGRLRGFGKVMRDDTARRRTEEELHNRVAQQAAVAELGRSALVGGPLQELMDQAVADAARLIGAEFSKIVELQPDGRTLLMRAGVGWRPGVVGHAAFSADEATHVGFTLHNEAQGPVAVEDINAETRFRYSPPLVEHGVRASMNAVIYGRERPFGVLGVCSRQPRRFTDDDVNFLRAIANVLAAAIERDRSDREREALLAAEQAARGEAEAANRMKDDFLATLSHELRTPLTAILGWAKVLRAGPADAAELAHGLETIERSANAQTQLIKDLLDVSRIVSGKLQLDVRPVDLPAVAGSAADALRFAAQAKRIRLETHFGPVPAPIAGDPDRIQQIVWNLLSNAIKFTPAGGRVEVALESAPGLVRIRVSDTGRGIPAEFLPHVFERFRQADSSTSRIFGGLGLGLAIVRNLAEMHGGTVRAESGGTGRGATFTVELPVRPVRPALADAPESGPSEPPAESEPAAPAPVPRRLDGVRVLVVDDEADAREVLGAVLKRSGAQVTAAASVREAMEQMHRCRPDVLVSDIGMPGEDGFALIREIKALGTGNGAEVPALALTAYAGPRDKEKVLAAGFRVHVAKPVEPEDLVEAVAELAERK